MANTKSAAKRARQTDVKTLRNRSVKTAVKSELVKTRKTIDSGDKAVSEASVKSASSLLDRAVKRGVLHKNAANRRKSSMAKAVARLS